jgi:hypothetical protein
VRLTTNDLKQLGVSAEIDGEFETNLLEVRAARFRITGISPRGVDVVLVRWLETPPDRRRAAGASSPETR